MVNKKLCLAVALLIILTLSSCLTIDKLAMSPLYSIKNETVRNISGDIDVSEMILYKKLMGNEVTTLKSLTYDGGKAYLFSVYYGGSYWKFIEKLQLKIDNELFTIVDKDPSRIAMGGGVSEQASFLLSKELIEKLKNCSSLVIQYYADGPNTLNAEAIQAIKDFLSHE